MGQWWAVRTNKNGAKQGGGGSSSNASDVWLYQSTRKDLVRYLKSYREMALQAVSSVVDDEDDNDESFQAALRSNDLLLQASNDKIEYYLKGHWKKDEPIWLADVEFPSLVSIAAEPYWIVQVDLRGRQRKVVHEACVETDLFHVTTVEGLVVITAYADGLEYLPGWSPDTYKAEKAASALPIAPPQPLYMYKPWVCRFCESDRPDSPERQRSNAGDMTREQADEAIHLLIDHPVNCLRDPRDALSYEELNHADLGDAPDLASTPFVYVDTVEKWKACAAVLQQAHELAFDIEAFAVQRYAQITCLIQFATDHGDEFVVDPLVPELWDRIHDDLAPILADPAIVKIGHSISGVDARSFHRDFGCFIVNAFDTYQAAKVLDLPSQGLASIVAHYELEHDAHYLTLKADFQNCDWRNRPLSAAQLDYARSDVRYLVMLRKLMMRDLVKNNFWDVASRTEESVEQERQEIAAWRQSLLRMEMLEDGMITEKEAMDPSTDPLVMWRPPGGPPDDDAITFRTSCDQATTGANTLGDDDLQFMTPATSGDALDQMNIDFDLDNEGVVGPRNGTRQDIPVNQLRLQAMLMRCLWLSQEGCRDFWSTGAVEPPLRNETFLDLQRRFKKNEITWHPSNTKLFEELSKWREELGRELECLPGFTISLDYLAIIAWKMPTTELTLRRIRYGIPHVLEHNEKYRNQMLDVVVRTAAETGATLTTNVAYYGQQRSSAFHMRSFSSRSRPSVVSSIDLIEARAFKMLVAGAIGAAIVGAIVDGLRKHKH